MAVFIDYDNTLVDLTTPVCEEINTRLELTLKCSNKDIKSYTYLQNEYGKWVNSILCDPLIYDRVQPFEGAVEFINNLATFEDITIITSCLNDELFEAKKYHLNKHFGNFPSIMADDKYKYLKEKDILMDDYFENVLNHYAYNKGAGILFNHNETFPYVETHKQNIKHFNKVTYSTSYEDAIKRIDNACLSISSSCPLFN